MAITASSMQTDDQHIILTFVKILESIGARSFKSLNMERLTALVQKVRETRNTLNDVYNFCFKDLKKRKELIIFLMGELDKITAHGNYLGLVVSEYTGKQNIIEKIRDMCDTVRTQVPMSEILSSHTNEIDGTLKIQFMPNIGTFEKRTIMYLFFETIIVSITKLFGSNASTMANFRRALGMYAKSSEHARLSIDITDDGNNVSIPSGDIPRKKTKRKREDSYSEGETKKAKKEKIYSSEPTVYISDPIALRGNVLSHCVSSRLDMVQGPVPTLEHVFVIDIRMKNGNGPVIKNRIIMRGNNVPQSAVIVKVEPYERKKADGGRTVIYNIFCRV